MRPSYQYNVVELDKDDDLLTRLNELGMEGWELIVKETKGKKITLIFKRIK